MEQHAIGRALDGSAPTAGGLRAARAIMSAATKRTAGGAVSFLTTRGKTRDDLARIIDEATAEERGSTARPAQAGDKDGASLGAADVIETPEQRVITQMAEALAEALAGIRGDEPVGDWDAPCWVKVRAALDAYHADQADQVRLAGLDTDGASVAADQADQVRRTTAATRQALPELPGTSDATWAHAAGER